MPFSSLRCGSTKEKRDLYGREEKRKSNTTHHTQKSSSSRDERHCYYKIHSFTCLDLFIYFFNICLLKGCGSRGKAYHLVPKNSRMTGGLFHTGPVWTVVAHFTCKPTSSVANRYQILLLSKSFDSLKKGFKTYFRFQFMNGFKFRTQIRLQLINGSGSIRGSYPRTRDPTYESLMLQIVHQN